MTTETMTLTDFLLARIAEDEVVARDAGICVGDRGFGDERLASGQSWGTRYHEVVRLRVLPDQDKRVVADAGAFVGMSIAPHIARHDPARVLAECEAKRAIVALHDHPDDEHCLGRWPCVTLRHIAAVYADHQDFREEWRV